ncbi:MAG: hypothetical protein ACI9O6_003068 [Glaciecola sp.]|jgi:hypothetical protein
MFLRRAYISYKIVLATLQNNPRRRLFIVLLEGYFFSITP